MKKVLFICTGNYYRSRFAQAVFNHLALASGKPWVAFSRGLNIESVANIGELSVNAAAELRSRGIDLSLAGDEKRRLTESDLEDACKVIALKRTEHFPMMQRQFPEWAGQIDYWEIHDTDTAKPSESLPLIAERIESLLPTLTE